MEKIKKNRNKAKEKETNENFNKMKFSKSENHIDVKSHIYSQEVNQHLLDEISILTNENESLKQQIKGCDSRNERDNKIITSLKEEIRNIVSTGGNNVTTKSSAVISSKITALCKQNRHLISELELCKTKYGQLERKLMEMESFSASQLSEDKYENSVERYAEESEIKELKDRLSQMTRKFVETKNKNTDLKNELLVANKYLQSEIGSSFTTIQRLSAESNGFKGRAEEIIILKNKIVELEEKLHGKNKTGDQSKEIYSQHIKDIELRRRSQLDKTIKDLEALQTDHNDLKLKYDGAMARNKILVGEISQMKQALQGLNDMSICHSKTKEDLMVQMKDMEAMYHGKLAENERVTTELKATVDRLTKDLESEKYRVSALVARLEEKNDKIQYLNGKVNTMVDSSLQKMYYTPLQVAANNEIKTLTDLLNKTNKRLEEERKKTSESEKMYFRARESKLIIQKKFARLGLEIKELKSKRIKSETSLQGGCNLSSKTSSSTIVHCTDKDCLHFEVERTNNKLELAQEEIKFLEARLKILEDEKAADFESIDEMIFNSKKIFADALKNNKE